MDGTEVHGVVEPGYEPVRAAFAGNFARRGDRGAAVSVYRHGRRVVDLVGGTAAPRRRWAVARGDGADGAVGHQGRGRGLPAAAPPARPAGPGLRPWGVLAGVQGPRQGAGDGTRRAGPPGGSAGAWDEPLTPEQALDGASGPRAVAAQQPLFAPGREHGYHAQTFSWLTGELVLRASGRTIGRFTAEEIARPLGLDLWIGLPDDRAGQVGAIGDTAAPEPSVSGVLRSRPKRSVHDAYADPDSLTRRAFAAITPLPDENVPAYRAGELAASGGIATARSLARFYASLVGEVEGGARLFAPATVTAARTPESDGPDRVLVVNTLFGSATCCTARPRRCSAPGSFGHPGRGGSLAFADPGTGTGFGYVTNGMQRNVTADPRAQALVRALRECLR